MGGSWEVRRGLIRFVVFDTSSLLLVVEIKRGVLEGISELIGPYVAVVPWSVVRELALVRRRSSKAAVKLVADRMTIADHPQMRTDDAVVWAAKRLGGYVVSGDREVRDRARRDGLPVISISKDGRVCVS